MDLSFQKLIQLKKAANPTLKSSVEGLSKFQVQIQKLQWPDISSWAKTSSEANASEDFFRG